MKSQKNIQRGDKVLAMLTHNGSVIAKLSNMDFDSVNEIIIALKDISGFSGLAQLFIRNFTQGWYLNSPLFVSNKRKIEYQQDEIKNVNKYGQYSFIF